MPSENESESISNSIAQLVPQGPSLVFPSKTTPFEEPAPSTSPESLGVDEHMFDEDLLYTKGTSFNILAISETIEIKGLIALSK